MGKDLKGKELGVGLSQRKDGRYCARFTNLLGKRITKYFWKLQEAKAWLSEAKYLDTHGGFNVSKRMSLDAWYNQWIQVVKKSSVSKDTLKIYSTNYKNHIKEKLGSYSLESIMPIHCQELLNGLHEKGYSSSVICTNRVILNGLFETAIENHLLRMNPITKSVKQGTELNQTKESRVLTREEQKLFMDACRKYRYYDFYALALQTGMRASELIGLTWECVDFANHTITINKQLKYDSDKNEWYFSATKNKKTRVIPMTKQAYHILMDVKQYTRYSKVKNIKFRDLVFINSRGNPTFPDNYDRQITTLCKKIGMEHFSLHTFRHTFATRCVEAGIKPKSLQIILGHSKIQTTMNIYAHVLEEEKVVEIQKLEVLYDAM